MNRLRLTVFYLTTLALGLFATSAHAAFHEIKVVEFFPGTTAAPNAQYVVLQMYVGGQTNLNSHGITIFNAAGMGIGSATFTGPVANGDPQAKILIAAPESNALFSMTADLTTTLSIPLDGGKICFDAIPADCVAWGSWNGDAGGVGTPYAATSGLRRNEAVKRDVGGNGLQDTDDTDDSAADFDPAIPAPQNNAGQLGTIPSSTCGNSEIEALEECDDGNTADGDACSSTCTAVDDVFVDGFESP